MPKKQTNNRKADQYDDPSYNYLKYWQGRDYENESEEIAINYLLRKKHFHHAIDIGGGYGRLSLVLSNYADRVTLVEPSKQQLEIADEYLKGHDSIEKTLGQANKLKFGNNSIDLAVMIRVMHHLPDPTPELKEIARVLSDDGYLILEVANYTHFRNRLKYGIKFKKFPVEPVDIRSAKNRKDSVIPFVNHNPKTVIKQLAHVGLKVEKTLSVSNLRSPALKKILPTRFMLAIEKPMQTIFAKSYFGPSVFFMIKKAS